MTQTPVNFNLGSFFTNGIKSVEKLALYVVVTLVSTGSINVGNKSVVIPSIAGVLAALHLSTPKQAS